MLPSLRSPKRSAPCAASLNCSTLIHRHTNRHRHRQRHRHIQRHRNRHQHSHTHTHTTAAMFVRVRWQLRSKRPMSTWCICFVADGTTCIEYDICLESPKYSFTSCPRSRVSKMPGTTHLFVGNFCHVSTESSFLLHTFLPTSACSLFLFRFLWWMKYNRAYTPDRKSSCRWGVRVHLHRQSHPNPSQHFQLADRSTQTNITRIYIYTVQVVKLVSIYERRRAKFVFTVNKKNGR